MAESVNLGRAHVEFTGDFGSLMDGIRHAVKVSAEATATIKLALSETDKQVERSSRNIIRSYAEMNREVRSHLRKITSELVFLQLDIGHIANQFQRMSIMASAAMAGAAAASISFEDAFANVRKTVDASEAEFRALERNLRQMSLETRTGANELAVIMGVAGQLGIRGVENLTNFTRVIDQLTVATTLTGEEGAQNLARLMNIMQESMGNVDRLGAAIVDLGNNFATTETEILNMSLRIAGAGKTIGLTTSEVLALATALSDVGIRAEMGGSAISRVMINMANAVAQGGSRLREFARVANVSTREFARIFREDPIQAIEMFIRGLERLDRQGKNVFAVLENVGASEIRVRDTLLRLFQAADRLADAVNRANRAWEENIALTEEFRKRNETAASQLRIAYNNIVEVIRIVGDEYNPIVKQAAQFTTNLVQALQAMTPEQRAAVAEFSALATAILGGVAAALLATKAFITFGTGIVLLARAVAALLSPWGLATIAIVTAAVVIARKWDEIVQMIEQTDLAQSARELWDKFIAEWETMTLPEKTLGVVTVAATVAWSLSFARSFASALVAQYAAQFGAGKLLLGGTGFLFRLGIVTASGALLWDLVPDNLQEKVNQFWNEVAQAIRDFNAETIKNPLIDKFADWLEGLSGEEWQTGALTVGVTFAAFRAIQAGSVIAARLGAAVARAIAGVAVPVAVAGGILVALGLITMDDEEKNRVKQEIQTIWENEEISITVKVAKILLTVTDAALRNFVEELDEKIFRPIGEIIGTRPSKEGQELQRILLMDPEERREEVRKLRESIGPTSFEAPPTIWDRILNFLGMGPKPPADSPDIRALFEQVWGIQEILDAIYRAEGGERARVPYGMTSFADRGNRFGLAKNQELFEMLQNVYGLEEGTKEYYEAAAAVSVMHYWEEFKKRFPEVADKTFKELSVEMQRQFIEFLGAAWAPPELHPLNANWTPNVQSILGIRGYSQGVILPGFGGGDRIPALLEPGEAVVPARVVQGGLDDIVAWFRRMGVRKLKSGDPSVGSTAAAIMAASSPREAIALAESMQADLSEEMARFAHMLLSGIEQITQAMSAFVFGAAQMIVDVLKALFPDHAETLQKGLDDLRAWWEQNFTPRPPAPMGETSPDTPVEEEPPDTQSRSLLEWIKGLIGDGLEWLKEQGEVAGKHLGDFGANILQSLTPVGIMAKLLNELQVPVKALLMPITLVVEALGKALLPVFKATFPIIKTFGVLLLTVLQGISTVWNALVGTIGNIFKSLSDIKVLGARPFKFLEGTANFFLGLQVDIKALADAQKELRDLTWEEALARAENIDAIKKTTEALRNVPSGFKIALARFEAATPVQSFATGGYVPPTPGGRIVRVAEGGEGEYIVPESKMGRSIVVNVDLRNSTIYGVDDLDRRITTVVRRALQQERMAAYGVT